MSGPKESYWEIERARREALKREREEKRQRQQREIAQKLEQVENRLSNIQRQHGKYADYLSRRVEGWMYDARRALNADLRDAWRAIKGIEKYLDTQERKLAEKAQAAQARQEAYARKQAQKAARLAQQTAKVMESSERLMQQIEMTLERLEEDSEAKALLENPTEQIAQAQKLSATDPKAAEERVERVTRYLASKQDVFDEISQRIRKQELAKQAIANLESIREDYAPVVTEGVEQRIALFKKALEVNPENPQIVEQIVQMREQLSRAMDEYEQKQDEFDYIKSVFSDVLGSDPEESGDGASIAGMIEGVPIKVTLRSDSHTIDMDTPTDGSCRAGIDAMLQKLESANVSLCPIRVRNTGEILQSHTQKTFASSKRIDA